MRIICVLVMVVCSGWSKQTTAKTLLTNAVEFIEAPTWLTEGRLEAINSRIANKLEATIRRVKAYAYADPEAFARIHRMGPTVVAFFRRADSTLHLGPRVTSVNFESIYGHELVHLVFFQKHQKAIPVWLEEGLANYIAQTDKVDYRWLAQQKVADVTQLKHPFGDQGGSKLHYALSTALIEMIAARCSLSDLLQLSVGVGMETYIRNYCEIADVNQAFRAWIKQKAGS